ncbi:hypothetical protein HT031_000387 [Scenedesmus sp. PABB004]|nr:hypothetical protein HT031_000387 [Scenedesmus sp. PABB004]
MRSMLRQAWRGSPPAACGAGPGRRRSAGPLVAPRCAGAGAGAASAADAPGGGGTAARFLSAAGGDQPWSIGSYHTKKLARPTDSLGNFVRSGDGADTADLFSGEAKLLLAVRVVARDAGVAEGELLGRVQALAAVLPDIDGLAALRPGDVARLTQRVDDVAAKLLALRQAFPRADVARLLTACGPLLLLGLRDFTERLAEAQALLAGACDPCRLLDAAPQLLDPAVLQAVLDDLARLFGDAAEPLQLLERDPGLALSCQSLQGQARGDRDAAYLGDIFGPASGGGSA